MNKRAKGCRNLHVARKGSNGLFETPVKIDGLESITTTNQYGEFSAYSDDIQDTYIKNLTSVDVAIQVKALPIETEALLMGKNYSNGKLVTNVNDTAESVALLYEITNIDGSSTYRVLYNVTLMRDESSSTTLGESIESQSVTLSGKALPLSDGNVDLIIESDDPAANADDIENFFKEVVMP